jgi:hypothetical protein
MPDSRHEILLSKIADRPDKREEDENAREKPQKALVPIREYPIEHILHEEWHHTIGCSEENHARQRKKERTAVGPEVS